jgi:homoserine dehydrogenase
VTTFELILVGFGNVGRRFAGLLDEKGALLKREAIDVRVAGVVTRSHGCTNKGRPVPFRGIDTVIDLIAKNKAAARDGRLVLVETTTLDIARGEPATTHVRAALAGGAHVITANKGPAAFAHHALSKAARLANRRFLFEGAVMDGVPVFNFVRETLPGVTVSGFRGVVNTTTNYMLTAMEAGTAFADALTEMQSAGIAEADASLDIDGWDAAAKTAALANALLDARITPHQVEREGITPGTGRRAAEARRSQRRLKLVASAGRAGDGVTARVALEELPADDLLASLDGPQNAIIFQTDLVGEVAIVQRGSGLTQTAYALLSDLITIARARPDARATRRPPPTARARRSPSPSRRRTR